MIRKNCGMQKPHRPARVCARTAVPSPDAKSAVVMSTGAPSESVLDLMSIDTLSDSDPAVGGVPSEMVSSVDSNCVWSKSTLGAQENESGSHPGPKCSANAKPSEEPPAFPSVKTKRNG